MDDQNPGEQNNNQQIADDTPPSSIIQPGTSADTPLPPRPNIPQVISSPPKPKRKWPKVLAVLAAVILIAAGGWYFFIKKDENKQVSNNAVQANKDIANLRVGLDNVDFGHLYPDMSTNEYSFMTNTQIFEGLVRYENKSKIVPALAADWTNPDGKTWVFTIKDNIKFHDGNPLTPEDVVYSIKKLVAGKSDLSTTFGSTIDTVAAAGPNKVKITTADPDPTLLNKLAFIYIIDEQLPKGQDPSLAGTGPYIIKPGTKPNSTNVQLTAYDNYYGGRPYTRELSFTSEPSLQELIKAFENNKYDIIGTVPPSSADQVKSAYKFVAVEPDVHFVAFNTLKGPLKNKKLREAIRYAFDPVAIGRARGNEVTPLSQMIPESIPGYNPAIVPYKQDIEKSKKLLKEAGYPNGLTLTFSTSDTDEATAEIVNELKKAGITIKVDQHKDFDEFIDFFISGKAEMYTVDYTSDTLDGLDIFSTTITDVYYKNPEFYKTLDKIGTTVDPATRLNLLQQAALIIDKDIPVVPLSTEDNLWLMNKDYDLVQDMPSSYISVYFYKARQK